MGWIKASKSGYDTRTLSRELEKRGSLRVIEKEQGMTGRVVSFCV